MSTHLIRRLTGALQFTLLTTLLTLRAEATHLQAGSISWQRDKTFINPGAYKIDVTVRMGFRWSYPFPMGGAFPAVGTIFWSGDVLQVYDKQSTALTPAYLYFTATEVSAMADWVVGEAMVSLVFDVNSFPITVKVADCCRSSLLLNGHDTDFILQTEIDPTKSSGSPVSNVPLFIGLSSIPSGLGIYNGSPDSDVPVVIDHRNGLVQSFPLISSTFDPCGTHVLTFQIAPRTYSGISFNPPNFSISPEGLVTCATPLPSNVPITDADVPFVYSGGSMTNGYWNVEFLVQERDANFNLLSQTPVDVMFTVSNTFPFVLFNNSFSLAPIAVAAGSSVSFNVRVFEPASVWGLPATLVPVNLPAGARMDPVPSLTGPAVTSSTFQWTPTAEQAGAHVLTFAARNSFIQGSNSITVIVQTCTPTPAAPTTTDPSSQTVIYGDNATFSVTASGEDSLAYHWQESTDSGATWYSVADGGVYSGVNTDTLTLILPPVSMNAYRYRCVVETICNALSKATTTAATLTVNPRPLCVTGTVTYNGTTRVDWPDLSVANLVGSDCLNPSSGAVALASPNAGAQTIVQFSIDLAFGGRGAGNYTMVGASGSVVIKPLVVALGGRRPYDGTASAVASILDVLNRVKVGLVFDDVDVASGTATLANSNFGQRNITSFGTLALGGAAAGNYTLQGAVGSVLITKLPVQLAGSRQYDGTSTADVSILSIANKVGNDALSLAGGPVPLGSSQAGTRAVTSFATLSLTGTSAGNYTLTGASGSVDIRPLPVELTGSRYWDGTAAADATILSIVNAIGGDTVTLSGSVTLASDAVGDEAITSFDSLMLGGTSAANYTREGSSGSVTINARPTTVTYTGPTAGVYGTCFTVTAALKDKISGLPLPNETIVFTIYSSGNTATAVTDDHGVASASIALQDAPNSLPATVPASAAFAGDSVYSANTGSADFSLKPSVATPLAGYATIYTGQEGFWTTSPNSSSASLALSATIQDASGSCAPNVTRSTITFASSPSGTPGTFTPLNGAANLPVGPVSPGLLSVGSAAAVTQYTIPGTASSATFFVTVLVNGDYTTALNVVPMSVCKPVAGTTSGWAQVNNLNAVGTLPGLVANQGYLCLAPGLQYSKSGSNPQGNIICTLHTGPTTGRKYVLKSNSISTFAIQNNSPASGANSMSFAAKCSIIDAVTGVSIDGGALMQVWITSYNNCKTGLSSPVPTVAISVNNTKTGGLWFGNNWNSTAGKVMPQPINSGCLLVQ